MSRRTLLFFALALMSLGGPAFSSDADALRVARHATDSAHGALASREPTQGQQMFGVEFEASIPSESEAVDADPEEPRDALTTSTADTTPAPLPATCVDDGGAASPSRTLPLSGLPRGPPALD